MDIDDERFLARREFFSLPGRRLELPFRPVPSLIVELLEAAAVARMHRRENSFPDHSTGDSEITPTMNGPKADRLQSAPFRSSDLAQSNVSDGAKAEIKPPATRRQQVTIGRL